MGIGEYKLYLRSDLQKKSACEPQVNPILYTSNVYQWYRSCKQLLQPVVCYSDLDCLSVSGGAVTCDLFNRVCKQPYQTQAKYFLQCVLSNLDFAQVFIYHFCCISMNSIFADRIHFFGVSVHRKCFDESIFFRSIHKCYNNQ